MTRARSREILEPGIEISRQCSMAQDRSLVGSTRAHPIGRALARVALVATMFLLMGRGFRGVVHAVAEDEPRPSFLDTPTPVPEPPTQKQIQRAVMRCLSSADSARAASRRNPRGLGMAEEGEERYCFEQKKECQKDAGGFSCRSFIRDYVSE